MKVKKKRTGKRVASNDLLSGVLDSPYGYMKIMVGPTGRLRRFDNGHRVVDGMLEGETSPHRVPEHWIKPDNDD